VPASGDVGKHLMGEPAAAWERKRCVGCEHISGGGASAGCERKSSGGDGCTREDEDACDLFFQIREEKNVCPFFFFEKENVWLLVGREWCRPFWALAHSVFVLALFFR
jgi:hypothetical protein